MGNTVKRISVFDNAITYYTTNDEKTEKKMIEFQPWMFTGPVKLKEKKWFTFRLQHPIWHLVMTKRQTNKIHFFFTLRMLNVYAYDVVYVVLNVVNNNVYKHYKRVLYHRPRTSTNRWEEFIVQNHIEMRL